ncbi:MAG: stage V sporulation protein AE [Christensenellales bacterium]|jgi:stage V sporulation protein AE
MSYVWAFLIGGAICVVGQILLDKTTLTSSRILVIFVVAGVVLGALGLYQPLEDFAGAGASIPLSGFGNSLAKGSMEAVDEMGVLGIFIGGTRAAAGGITAALFFGYLNALIFRPRMKK